MGQPRTSAGASIAWDVQIRRRLIGSGTEALQSLLGPEARAQKVINLSAAERPFAVGEGAKGWLDEASVPLEGSGASLSSLYGLPEGFSPNQQGIFGDGGFDLAAEEQRARYLASLSSNVAPTQTPSAAERDSPGWWEKATVLLVSITTLCNLSVISIQ